MDNNFQQETVRDTEYDPKLKSYKYYNRTYKVPFYKPVVSYWKTGDPTKCVGLVESKLTEITIIRTKQITPEFRDMCIKHKSQIYLHLIISGLNQTPFEPNIPTVRDVFMQLKDLLDNGFPIRQVLVIIDPVVQNDNGLKVLKLILRIFTEIPDIRIRKIRISLLWYKQSDNGEYEVGNRFIKKRQTTTLIKPFIVKTVDFQRNYYKVLEDYSAIINVDNGDEPIIGLRELNALGYKNEYIDEYGHKRRIIEYKDAAKRWEPDVQVISGKSVRCINKCLLCPFFG